MYSKNSSSANATLSKEERESLAAKLKQYR